MLAAWGVTASAQTPANARVHRASVVAAAFQDQPPDEPIFRFSRPIVRIGQDFSLGEGELVREVHSGLADITIAGTVEQDVVSVVGSLRLTSTAKVGGSIIVIGGPLTIDQGAVVERDLVVVGGSISAPPDFAPGGSQAVIGNIAVGNTLHALVPWITRGLLLGRLIVPDLSWVWTVVAVILFIYLMVNALFVGPVGAAANTVSARPISSFLLGLLVLVLMVPAIAILAATVIGIAIVPFVLCAIVVAGLVGKVGVIRAIGRAVWPEGEDDSRVQSFRSVILGFAVLTVAYMIPVVGLITWAITGVIGLGGATAAFRAAMRREHPPRVRTAAPAISVEPQPAVVGEPAAVAPVSAFTADAAAADAAEAAIPTPPPPRSEFGGDMAVYPRATFFDRVAAFALDAILVAIAVNLLGLVRRDDDMGWYPLMLLAYHVAFWAWRGTTLGGIIIGLRVVRVQGTDLRFVDALVRGLTSVFSIVALGIGCFWMLQDPEKQMWHDKIAGTLVVKVPRHLVLP